MISIQIPFYFCSIIVCPSLYARQPASLSDEGALEEIVWCHSALSLACLTLACRVSSLLFLLLAYNLLACKMLDACLLARWHPCSFSQDSFNLLTLCDVFRLQPILTSQVNDYFWWQGWKQMKWRLLLPSVGSKIVFCRFDTHVTHTSLCVPSFSEVEGADQSSVKKFPPGFPWFRLLFLR